MAEGERFCLSCGLNTRNACVVHDTYTVARSTGDRTFLWWLYNRFTKVLDVDPGTDYVMTLKEFAQRWRPCCANVRGPEITDCDWEELEEAIDDSISNAEGRINKEHLKRALIKRGLTIYKDPTLR